ncbi:hypothetical protein Gotur_025905, partial [Gossypium turneri]
RVVDKVCSHHGGDVESHKYYKHKEFNLNFRSLAEVKRYESRGIYPGVILAFQLLQALTYEGTEQLDVEEPDASTNEIIIYEIIQNVDTYNSPKKGMCIPQEQCQMTEPCNNMYMPNRATTSAPKGIYFYSFLSIFYH